jgi:hypothetical protein
MSYERRLEEQNLELRSQLESANETIEELKRGIEDWERRYLILSDSYGRSSYKTGVSREEMAEIAKIAEMKVMRERIMAESFIRYIEEETKVIRSI